jgi:HAD superfamily hydrolase (TIGR01490 family)
MNSLPKHSSVAAFFDLDGTLIPFPSLERRMLRALLYRRAIPAENLMLWAAEALRLAPRGLSFVRQGNKRYLQGISLKMAAAVAERVAGEAALAFFPEAVERAAWHASQGHRIVLLTGTLQLLAAEAARSLEAALARRGVNGKILVVATRLQEFSGRWTGRVVGFPMFGAAKGVAIRSLAVGMRWDLEDCFAYGDSIHDQAMLECVGHAIAVNASPAMRRVAIREGWRVVDWHEVGRVADHQAGIAVPGRSTRQAERNVETLG